MAKRGQYKRKEKDGIYPVYLEYILKAEGQLHIWQSSIPKPPLWSSKETEI